MAQAPKGKRTGTVQQVESKDGGVQFEAVKEIEEETLKAIKSAKTFDQFCYSLRSSLVTHEYSPWVASVPNVTSTQTSCYTTSLLSFPSS